ncbi:hypothetical protein CDL12_16359 [Handroanthus impetiginosus]|uniref:Uncharacterized protein n=1 Tax=Handroanthus impetiginosus TaxID=429701 RepID=A0A2G9H187_9LAMI|nr:hypothetical protein CDL12_16359 [Handroanthus impetiginosus]
MAFDEVMKSVGEKLKEALLAVEKWGAEALAWFDGAFPPDTRREKLKEALLAVENGRAKVLAWFDGVFPPETRGEKIRHWFHVAQPYLIAAVVLTLVVYFCRCCCGGPRGGRRVKMMKAPGKNHRMPRRDFENNPKGYFQNLRSHPG